MASILGEYISQNMSILDLRRELTRLRKVYNDYTGRNLFIYAADLNKSRQGIDVSLMQDDFYMIQDILRESSLRQIDFYIETPGGSGEVAEEIARFLHTKFEEVNFVVAGEAKSAGTILVMCADNIYMCSTGSLGPIDAQVKIGRSIVSAYDYKKWVDDKKDEANQTGKLNPFDAIVISQISPGELYGVVNSLQFAQDLVKSWLPKYKFKNWSITKDTKRPVTQEMKEKRAEEISQKLSNHMDWKTHGRSLKIEDLREELLIEDIDTDSKLADIVYRIKTIIRLIFDTSTDFKLYFWEDCEISRSANVANPTIPNPRPSKQLKNVEVIEFTIQCPKCKKQHKIRGYVDISSEDIRNHQLPINPMIRDNDILVCDNNGCGFTMDVKPIKNDIESKLKKRVTLK